MLTCGRRALRNERQPRWIASVWGWGRRMLFLTVFLVLVTVGVKE
jgi:hypothetical protein